MNRKNNHREEIEQRLNEKISDFYLLKETECSFLYFAAGKEKYILKLAKGQSIKEEFSNHKTVYECWKTQEQYLSFKIPKVYFLSNDETFYVMEYIENGINLLDILFQNRNDIDDIFRKTGRCLKQYHDMATKYLYENRKSFFEHNTIRQIMEGRKGTYLKKILDSFDDDSYRIIFKDFKPTNVVVDEKGDLYFVDFQNIYYHAPFYYDLARFVDTVMIFSIVKKPVFALVNFAKIKMAVKNFLQGYGKDVNKNSLKKMRTFHRHEHLQMKKNKNKLNTIILKILYQVF